MYWRRSVWRVALWIGPIGFVFPTSWYGVCWNTEEIYNRIRGRSERTGLLIFPFPLCLVIIMF